METDFIYFFYGFVVGGRGGGVGGMFIVVFCYVIIDSGLSLFSGECVVFGRGNIDGVDVGRCVCGVIIGRCNISGVVDFAMFIQHMPFETLHVFAFKFTDLTLKLMSSWGGGIFIVCDII